MKCGRSSSFLLLFFSILCIGCNGQTSLGGDSKMYEKLMKINFKDYENKEVKYFFDDFGYDYLKYIPYMKKPGYISHVIFRYSDSLSIDIAVKDLGQREPLNFNYKLDIKEFEKKKINWICFKYAGRCIKGCDEEVCN